MQSSRVLDVDLLSSHELITINLDEFATDEGVDGMVELFVENRVAVPTWVRIVEEITSLGRLDKAHSVAESGLGVVRVPLPLYLQLVSLNLALARRAPRTVLPSALPTQPKEHFYARANHFLSLASNANANDSRVMDAKATYALARGKLDEASKHFEQLLRSEPTHLYALLGRARIAYARKNYRPAIKAYQTVLSYEPKFLPDPRIGLGLCFWAMGDTAKAQMAWERSLVVHPDSRSTSAMVLLGLSYISSSKKSQLYLATGAQGRTDAYDKGIKLMQAAFKKDNTNPTVAAALASFFLTTGQLEKTVKLAERTIQYAETKALLSEGHLLLARVKQAQGDDPGAMSEYSIVLSLMPEHPIALLALAQSLTRSGGYPDASNIFLGILQRDPRNVEALASLAAIHTHLAFATTSLVDSTNERIKAEELYEKLLIIFTEARLSRTRAQEEQGIEASIEYEPGERMGELENDPEMLIELAKLNADKHDLEKTQSFYIKAAQVYSSLEKPVPLRLSNNLAVLAFLRGEFAEAQSGFEQALAKIAVQGGEGDTLAAMIVALAYNLAVTNEALGDDDLAKKGYEAVLAQHGEFVDAKARLALLALRQNSPDLAHSLIKEALSSQPSNPEIRALYTYFLISIDSIRPARDFTLNTLREHSRHDLYALCAAGWINYVQARENKDTSREAGKDRAAKFLRTAEFYEKALLLDPGCAFAAQGLAISIAEGTLGVGGALSEGKDGGALSENATRARNSRDALNVFVKVKEAAADGGVFVNIGHCHFARDEWERAIESYETASRRFYGHKNIPTLLYLARSWYHKANKDSSFSDMQHCVSSIKTALELAPNDLAIIFNLALAEQKGFEILSSLPCERRTLDQCVKAGEDIVESQSLFERLTMNPTPNTPYDPTLPGSRMKYGVSLERKRHELVSAQTAFAEVELTRINEAKVIRDAEKARLEEIEMARREKERETAEKLEEQRRILREEAREYGASKFDSDDDDKKKRGKGNKRKSGKGKKDGDGSESDEAPEKPKRKKKGKKDADTTDSDEDDDKPKKKRKSKPDEMDLDSDGEEKVRATHSRKAKSKVNMSAEFVSDTDSD